MTLSMQLLFGFSDIHIGRSDNKLKILNIFSKSILSFSKNFEFGPQCKGFHFGLINQLQAGASRARSDPGRWALPHSQISLCMDWMDRPRAPATYPIFVCFNDCWAFFSCPRPLYGPNHKNFYEVIELELMT
jgi:hypothetical protein